MYAFTAPLRQAWKTLLNPLGETLREINSDIELSRMQIGFDTNEETYLSPDLLFGHTCGYPYMLRWRRTHRLLCVPEFDITGCKGTQYASWFICRSDDTRDSLASFYGATAAINGPDSNSGMNVLRYAVSQFARDGNFFNRTLITGSHLNSFRSVVIGDADIASIDPITYHHIMRSDRSLENATKIVGQSAYTTGLPFIAHRDESTSCTILLQALNQCVEQSEHEALDCLRLNGFSSVSETDYDTLMKLESDSVSAGYPALN